METRARLRDCGGSESLGYTSLMQSTKALAAAILLLAGSVVFLLAQTNTVTSSQVRVPGLKQPVEVLRDHWGVPHIYAKNQDDLFFAQGYLAATDRLFQLDLWRRIGSGKLSEVFGPNYIARDRIARLVRYRGNWDDEWRSYAPDARQIATAFANGINAYIRGLDGKRPEEFRIAGFDPGLWVPEDVTSRMAGLTMTGNAGEEVQRAQQVARLGLPTIQLLSPPDPAIPLVVPKGLDLADVTSAILRDYGAAVSPLQFPGQQGSNNWVVDGSMSETGKPLLANDPHRAVTLPSLRKTVHLVAPGWNVIGAGEPALPGIALGHNEEIAWGFTIVGIDQQDLYVEKTNPENPYQYQVQGTWKEFKIDHETIAVKGAGEDAAGSEMAAPEPVDLKYTTHGPVVYQDIDRHRAYSLRWVGQEPGSAGYLPALSLARAKSWSQFQKAVAGYKIPSENLVYADRQGNIGWIAAGLAPVRQGWAGLFPVPGDSGQYEWNGFLPADDHPSEFNPARHYIATANHNILPPQYPYQLTYYWASPERYQRIVELLGSKPKFSVADFERMQQDTVSLVARDFTQLLDSWWPPQRSPGAIVKAEFAGWDANLAVDSKQALLYEVWVTKLRGKLTVRVLPVRRTDPRVVLETLKSNPQLDQLLTTSLKEAMDELERRLGPDQSKWTWGRLHRILFHHPMDFDTPPDSATSFGLSGATTAVKQEHAPDIFDIDPVARPGDGNTINATGGPNYTEAYGASFREVIDVSDWDRSMMTNTPGESGVPGSKHYKDLVGPWAAGDYHPMPFTRKAVEAATEERLLLVPVS